MANTKLKGVTQEEIDFTIKSTAKNVGQFADEYIKRFGVPKAYTRPMTLYYGRPTFIKKQDAKFKADAKKKLTVAMSKKGTEGIKPVGNGLLNANQPRAESMPDEGALLIRISNRLGRVEAIGQQLVLIGQKNIEIQQKTYELFAAKMQKPITYQHDGKP